MRKTLLATVVAVLVFVAAGCGGSDESSSASPADEWADGFCTAITTWTDSIKSVTEQFTDLSSFSQDGLDTAASDAKSATEKFVDDVKGLGAPDTESGQAVKDSIDELSSTVESEVAKIEETAQGVSGLTDIPGAASSITSSLTAMSTALSSTVETLTNADAEAELRTALEDSPVCGEISS
ncbi:MAG: hypothetical protein ACRDPV_15645 [Gaiellaceae bacterium]